MPGISSVYIPALLALADGSVFSGISVGFTGVAVGEVVFNTAMTGYQEILTDPSYAHQMITFTCPHIGNVGINAQDMESNQVWATGVIMKSCSALESNWRSQGNLIDFLQEHKIVAISGIDTRRLTQIIRKQGAQNGCIMAGNGSKEQAIQNARACVSLFGQNLTQSVSTEKIFEWPHFRSQKFHVIVYDFGVKRQILQELVHRDCYLTLVPAKTPAQIVLDLNPDGICFSNGPGDPEACSEVIQQIVLLKDTGIPLFGICLGFQLLALACGAKTVKMRLGHHGANHPVLNLETGRVDITSQNHGFMVDENTLPSNMKITHRSLFDQSLQGFHHRTRPIFGFQGHPEASPGPREISSLFDHFVDLMKRS